MLTRRADPEVASVSLDLVRSIMRDQDLAACPPRAYKVTTRQDPDADPIRDRVGRDFTAEAPGVEVGRRHHLHQDLGGLVVSGHRDRLLHPAGRRLVDGCAGRVTLRRVRTNSSTWCCYRPGRLRDA